MAVMRPNWPREGAGAKEFDLIMTLGGNGAVAEVNGMVVAICFWACLR